MQKIEIKNFGAIKHAEIEVKKVLVLIGEQASGKSTISKLIYFFKILRDELFNRVYQDSTRDYFDIPQDLIFPIRQKFYDFFGSTFRLPDFEITYYYSVENNRFLKLTLNRNKKLHPKFSDSFLSQEFKFDVTKLKKLLLKETTSRNVHEQLAHEQNKLKYIQQLSSFVNDAFNSYQDSSLFIIAGRNATVSYSELFEKYLFLNLQTQIEDNKRNSFKHKEQTIDETLMLSFVERVSKMKKLFEKYGSFEGLLSSYAEVNVKKDYSKKICDKINTILKGNYTIDRWGEKILIDDDDEKYVFLHNASSGQQEAVRILQDIFLTIVENQKVLRIIEEPEAHLFPEAQKLVIELLAMMVNSDDDNQVIITTHSPYVLTVFNNLLFADRVIKSNESVKGEVAKVVDVNSLISSSDFSSYSLGEQLEEGNDTYCLNIINEKTGLIDQNYLDTVSETLNGDFRALYSLHSKSFARK